MIILIGTAKEDQKRWKNILEEGDSYRIRFNAFIEGYGDGWEQKTSLEDCKRYLQNILNLSLATYGDLNEQKESTAVLV